MSLIKGCLSRTATTPRSSREDELRDEATRTRGSLDTPIHTHTIAGRRIA